MRCRRGWFVRCGGRVGRGGVAGGRGWVVSESSLERRYPMMVCKGGIVMGVNFGLGARS